MKYDVFVMCNPLYDIIAEIPEAILDEINVQKGGMFLIDGEQQKALVGKVSQHIVKAAPGGSGANTAIGIGQLGGKACYIGKVANDEHGTLYSDSLRSIGVDYPVKGGDGVTGISVILVTPDTERTMCTFLGICRELGPEDVDLEALRQSKYLYVTGFLWDTETQKAAVLHAMREAKKAGVKVAMSLSDSFCVGRHKADFTEITLELVDLLIGNQDEAQMLTDTKTPEEAIAACARLASNVAVTIGSKGSILWDGERLHEIPVTPITPVDANGAGDSYAAGLLYGLSNGLSWEKSGRLGAYTAGQVVSQLGPRLDSLDRAAIEAILAG